MSDIIRDSLKKIVGNNKSVMLITGKVVAVNNDVCDVDPSDASPTYFDVRLRALIDGKASGLIVVPKVTSEVVIGLIDKDNAILLSVAEPEKVIIKLANNQVEINDNEIKLSNKNVSIEITDSKVSVKNGTTKHELTTKHNISTSAESLKSILTDLITGIETLTVTTAGVPSLPPNNVALFTAIKARLNLLLS